MDRLIGTIIVLILIALLLPTLAAWAVAAVPSLIALVVALSVIRLALPPPRRRR